MGSGVRARVAVPAPLLDIFFSSLVISRLRFSLRAHDRVIAFRPTVAEELPDVAHVANQIQIHIGDHDVVRVALRRRREELAARVAEIALAVKLADPPRLLEAGTVD